MEHRRTKRRPLLTDCSGVVSIEAAIIIPLFFLLVFGIIGLSIIISTKSTIQESLRTAARRSIVNGYISGGGNCISAAQNEFQTLLGNSFMPVQLSNLTMSRTTQNGFPGILVSAQTQSFCPGCELFIPGMNLGTRTDTYFMPTETDTVCPTVS